MAERQFGDSIADCGSRGITAEALTPEVRGKVPVATLWALAHHDGPRPARRDHPHEPLDPKPFAEPAARGAARDAAPDAEDPALRGARLGRLSRRQDLRCGALLHR